MFSPKPITTLLLLLISIHMQAQDGVIPVKLSEKVEYVSSCWENRCLIKRNGQYGFCDTTGRIVIDPQYSSASRFENGYAKVEKNNKSFYIDAKGLPLFRDKFGYLEPLINNWLAFTDTSGLKGIIDPTGKVLLKPAWKKIERPSDKDKWMLVRNSEDKEGFINELFQLVIPCEYATLSKADNGLIRVGIKVNDNYKYGVINKQNKIVVPIQYDYVLMMNGISLLSNRDKNYQVYEHASGNITDTDLPYYSSVNYFNPNYKILKTPGGKYGLYNSRLKKLFEMDNADCRLAGNNLGIVAFKKNDLWGLLDTTGKVILEPQYNDISFYQNGLLSVKNRNNLFGYVDARGVAVIPPQFTRAQDFYSSYAGVTYNGEPMLIKKNIPGAITGVTFIKLKQPVDKVYAYSENRMAVKVGDKFGYIDSTGKLVIKPLYVSADEFKNGTARVSLGNGPLYINLKGEQLAKPKYGKLNPAGPKHFSFTDSATSLVGLLDASGKELCPAKWKGISWLQDSDGLFKARDAVTGKSGIVNAQMEVIIPFEYDGLWSYERGLIIAEKDQDTKTRWGLIDEKNNIVVPIEYSRIYPMEDNILLERMGQTYKALDLTNGKLWETNIPYYMRMNGKSRHYKIAEDQFKKLNLYNSRLGIQYNIVDEDAIIVDDEAGLVAVKKRGLWGLRNADGNLITNFEFDDIDFFSNGMARVEKNGLSGMIDRNGKIQIPIQFEYIAAMHDNYAGVRFEGENKILRFNGHLNTPIPSTADAKVKATFEAVITFQKNYAEAITALNRMLEGIELSVDGSAKGPNNTVTSLAITYNQQIKNNFNAAMRAVKNATAALEAFDRYKFSGICDNLLKIGDARDKCLSAMKNIQFEESRIRTSIDIMNIEYLNRTTYQLWYDNAKSLRKVFIDRMQSHFKQMEMAGNLFNKEMLVCIEAVDKKLKK